MRHDNNSAVYLKDYRPPDHRIETTRLDICLDFETTLVHATHQVIRQNKDVDTLVLDCELMEIESISINDRLLEDDAYFQNNHRLFIHCQADQFKLDIVNRINPSANTALSGLYQSGDLLCTQCEAEGFRRITPAVDRPDNLTRYTVTLRADNQHFPVLLCNGNRVESGVCGEKQGHFATWHDPFPKPTYLFAIVAGKLACLEDEFITRRGKRVNLKFLARHRDISKCHHAMTSLKKAMRWDEEVYGREYDLELFHVVAVNDFNMGAMENKSLNIFNTKYVLADSKMATDTDFQHVESVIAHEYFHNWSGNRVTCRDWFQLSLKEGFTVFRDQAFSADIGSRGVTRINDVNLLRIHQFKEDAGPMAHPVRPESYQEINNFYTATVYNKGAEVVRMLQTLIGRTLFRRGCDLYFSRHDGQAVTTDDFVACMEQVSGQEMCQFKRWYSQSGTPVVSIDIDYTADRGRLVITLKQTCPPTPDQAEKKPFVIPVSMAIFDHCGNKIPLRGRETEITLVLRESRQKFVFEAIDQVPYVASLLRSFSAPVKLNHAPSERQLAFLVIHDDDPFNRWEATQQLLLKEILLNIDKVQSGEPFILNDIVLEVFDQIMDDTTTDPMLLAQLWTLPTISYIEQSLDKVDPIAIAKARNHLNKSIAQVMKSRLIDRYGQCQQRNKGQFNVQEVSARALRDACLRFLCILDDPDVYQLAIVQLKNAKCMTDSSSALSVIAQSSHDQKDNLLDGFYQQWKEEPLVIDLWLRSQAVAVHHNTLNTVKQLTEHPGFNPLNPNKVYSLIMGFTHGNPECFHAEDGSGYQFLVEWVQRLDPVNPQVSARLVSGLIYWNRFESTYGDQMRAQLQQVADSTDLSNDVAELVRKSLPQRN